MPGEGPLANPCDVVYGYDGSLPGFYCCVWESVYTRKLPLDIWSDQALSPSLLPLTRVPTDRARAEKVRAAVSRKISPRARELTETVFLSCLAQKEMRLLRFLLRAFREGPRLLNMLGDSDVHALLKAEKHLGRETHLLTGFIRFADIGGRLVSTIQPKNFVLPFLADHFADRFSQETFLIYDKTHRAALVHQNRRSEIVEGIEDLILPETTDREAYYQALWKQFYHTLAIEARHNPKCRMNHMPKRYWSEMVEMRDQL